MPFSDEYTQKIAQLVKAELEKEILRKDIKSKACVALANYRLMEAFEKNAGFMDNFKTFVTTVGIGALMSYGTPEAKATAKDVENQLKELSLKTHEKFKNDKNVYMELRHEGYKTFKNDEDSKDGSDRYKFKIKVGPYETEGVFASKVDEYDNTAEIGVQKDIKWKVVDKELLEKTKNDKDSKYDDLKNEVQNIINSMEATLSKGQHKFVNHDRHWITPDVKQKLKVVKDDWIAEHFDQDLESNYSPFGAKYWDGDNVKYEVFQKDVIKGMYDDLKNDKNILKEFQVKTPSFAEFEEEIYNLFGKDPKKFYDSTLSKKMKKMVDDKIKYKEIKGEKKFAQKLDKEMLSHARDWISDCSWNDLDPEDVDDLTDDEVAQGVRKHYNGGILGFIRDHS